MDENTLLALQGMGDITEQQLQQYRMLQLAKQLRGASLATPHKDVGSQIARAAYGIGGAIGDYRGMSASQDITRSKQDLFRRLLGQSNTPQPGGDLDL